MATSNVDASFTPVVSDNQFKEIIAQRDDLVQIVGGRMLPPSAETVYNAGQVLAQFTSGSNTGLWAPYDTANSGASDGSQTPAGVLYGGADVLADGTSSEIRVIVKGSVFRDLLIYNVSGVATSGLLAADQTKLGGKVYLIHGTNVLKI